MKILNTIRAVLTLGIVCTMLGGQTIEAYEMVHVNIVEERQVSSDEEQKQKQMINDNANTIHLETESSVVIDDSSHLNLSEEEKLLLAKLIMAEAEGESYKGKLLVAQVILNRYKTGKYENITEIIYERNQFSCVNDGRLEKSIPSDECWKAVEEFQDNDISQGALFFCTEKEGGWHERNLDYLFTECCHKFYKLKQTY